MSVNDEIEAVKKYVDQRVLDEHRLWHRNMPMGPGSGTKFLEFHRGFIGRFDVWRQSNGYPPLTAWDPGTPIPIPHPGRDTDNPFLKDPRVKRPTWLQPIGGFELSPPPFQHRYLGEFRDSDELGTEMDAVPLQWHGKVHVTIGGDMRVPETAPKDPIFWRWHKFIDNIYAEWEGMM